MDLALLTRMAKVAVAKPELKPAFKKALHSMVKEGATAPAPLMVAVESQLRYLGQTLMGRSKSPIEVTHSNMYIGNFSNTKIAGSEALNMSLTIDLMGITDTQRYSIILTDRDTGNRIYSNRKFMVPFQETAEVIAFSMFKALREAILSYQG